MSQKKSQTDQSSPSSARPSRLLTPNEVAEALGVSVTTLAVWRCRRRYPLAYVKCGSRVMYREEAVEKFLRDRTRGADENTLT